MNKLKELADQSVKGIKHEIYAKDSTGEHVTAGEPASSGDRKITIGFDARYVRSNFHCDVCNMDMPSKNMVNHVDGKRHVRNVQRRAQGLPPQ